jgi:transcriptional regulator NrdR family protein
MICPDCQAWTRTLETRERKLDNTVRRRYECANGHRFSTLEEVAKKPATKGKPLEKTA